MFSLINGTFKRIKETYTIAIQYNVWHLAKHEVWVTASAESFTPHSNSPPTLDESEIPCTALADSNYINDWSFNPTGAILCVHRSFVAHRGHIMGVKELASRAAVATCALDRKVRIWDLCTGSKIGSLKPKHCTGVRSLDCTSHSSNLLISAGYEGAIKVWSTELAMDRAYVGALEGHKTAVVAAKFLAASPFAVSVDESRGLRVWDVRKLQCLQSIVQPHKNFTCSGLCTIGEDQFIIYGRGLLSYDTILGKMARENAKLAEDAYPFRAELNTHTQSLLIATRVDVRFHDLRTGRLVKVLSRFVGLKGELTAFCANENHRRLYLGDACGALGVYSANSGAHVKSLAAAHSVVVSSSLQFISADKILLSAAPSALSLYDEASTKLNYRLRKIEGIHSITCVSYSEHLSLIATGTSKGEVVIWDYEKSRVEGMCKGHAEAMLEVVFVEPYPLLLASSADGAMSLWGVRGALANKRYDCLAKLLNVHEETCVGITSCITMKGKGEKCFYSGDKEDVKKMYRKCLKVEEDWRVTGESKGESIFLDLNKPVHNTENILIVLGDERGRLRIANLTPLIESLSIAKADKYRSLSGHSFNPRRKENIDASSTIQHEILK